jgi:uncharacterized protein YceK
MSGNKARDRVTGRRDRVGLAGVAAVLGMAVLVLCASCGKKTAPKAKKSKAGAAAAATAGEKAAGAAKQPPAAPTIDFPLSLVKLTPAAAEYGTKPDRFGVQKQAGAGVIDTTPEPPHNNAGTFWPKALKIVTEPPAADFQFPEGQSYASSQTNLFASEGFFVTGVGLWGRTRNMYHWVDYDVPPGATRFTGDVLITDDPFGWFAGLRPNLNQQFDFFVQVDGQEVFRQGSTRLQKQAGSGEKLHALDIPLPSGAKKIRFALEVSDWGDGNKNIELVITEGTFHGDEN